MISIHKKSILIFIINYSLILSISAQNKEVTFSAEYSPNYSNITDAEGPFSDIEIPKLSHNAVVRIVYEINNKLSATIGLGYYNVGNANQEMEVRWPNNNGNLGTLKGKVESKINYNYFLIPLGLRYDMSQWYVFSELGIGFQMSNNIVQKLTFQDGETEVTKNEIGLNFGEYSKITLPVSFTIARDIPIGNNTISTGLKVYYGLNQIIKNVPRKNNYYGLGLVFAIQI